MRCFKDGKFSTFRLWILISLFLMVLSSANHSVLMGQTEEGNGVLRARAYKFNYITSRQAQEMLAQLNIGTSFDELSDNVLIVASNRSADLIKATEVLSVLDQSKPVSIWVLMVGTEQQPLPNPDVLGARMQAFTVGTMLEAPPKGSTNPVILDIIDNKLIGIAAEELLPEIQEEVNAWREENPPGTVAEESTQMIIEPVQPQVETTRTGEDAVPAVMEQSQESTPRTIEDLPGTAAAESEPEETEGAETKTVETELTEIEPTEEPAAKPVQVQPDLSLQEAMTRLLEQEDEFAVPEATPTEQVADEEDTGVLLEVAEPNTTEDYFGDELLKVLLDEEEKMRPQPEIQAEPTEPEVTTQPEIETETIESRIVTEPEVETETVQPESEAERLISQTPDLGEEKTLKEAIQILLQQEPQQQTQQEQQQTAQAEEPAAVPIEESTPVTQRSEAVSENLRMQREMAILRQQLTQLQAQQQTAVPPDEIIDQAPEVEEQEPKIITKNETEPSLTEFEKQVGETELETIVNVPQEVELDWLVELVGKQLGLNYMYDPAILRNQKVTLKIHKGQIRVKDLYSLLESVMRFKGYVMTRRGNLVTILKSSDANQVAATVDTVFRMPGDPIQPGDVIVSTLFQLDHISTSTAKGMLTNMRLGLANGLQEVPETNTLIVTDYAYRMPRIEEVLEMIDVVGEEKEFKYRALKYMQAAELVGKLQELVEKMEGVSMQTAAAQPAQAARFTTRRQRNPETGRIETVRVPVSAPAAATPPAASKETVFIDTDDRTNRILMIGNKSQIETIDQLIDTLDVPQYNLKFVREYVIQNVEAVDVVNVLNELGLANLQVSGGSASTAQSATARRAAAARTARAQPNQPQQAAAPATAPSVSGGEDQPNISIRSATNSLLVNGTEEQHQAIDLVIAYVDVVQKDQRQIREYEIQYVDTQEIIDTMTELGIISTRNAPGATATQQRGRTANRTGRTTQPSQPAQAGEAAGPAALSGITGEEGAAEDITAQEPQIAVLEATNSLLVYATPRQHKAISLLIAHADRVPETTTTPYVVYALENQDPLELAEVLTKLVQETVEEVGATSRPEDRIQTARTEGAASGGPLAREEQNIKIIPDEMSYSLIVYANKRNQQWIAELIDELDEYRPQVLLDCTLVEVTKDDEFQYSIDLVGKTYDGTTLQPGTPVTQPVGVTAPFSSSTLADASTIGGNITAFLNTGSVQALLTAMQSKGFGRIMSQPKLLVNDNQEGQIKSETQTSIAQKKTIVQPGSESGNSTITTEDVSFNEYSSGVTLKIKPHISKGDMLRLEITLTRADFRLQPDVTVGTSGTFPRPPDILSTDVTSVATVPDGTTIVLGGLESVTQNKSQSKVPILGDIPLLGTLFRSVGDTDEQSKLYIFVKAHVIRPGDQVEGIEDIRRVSDKYRAEFEEMEQDFQGLQDFPSINPKPMDPVQVLEEDEIIENAGLID